MKKKGDNSNSDTHLPQFAAALQITQISSTIFIGIPLGSINLNTGFSTAGKSTTTSPAPDLNMNFDPVALFANTRAFAAQKGLNVASLGVIIWLGSIKYLPTSLPSSRCCTKESMSFIWPLFWSLWNANLVQK